MKLEVKVTINGEEKKLEAEMSIASLIEKLGLDVERVAVEKNLEIIPISEHEEEKVLEGDKIEIVSFIGGG